MKKAVGGELAQEKVPATGAEEETDLPTWLQGVGSPEDIEETAETALEELEEGTAAEPTVVEEESIEVQEHEPGWLRILREEGSGSELEPGKEPPDADGAEGLTEEEVEAEIPAWLRDLQAQDDLGSSAQDTEPAVATAPGEMELPSEESLTEAGLIDELAADPQLAEEAMAALAAERLAGMDSEEGPSVGRPPSSEERQADLPSEDQLEEDGLLEEAAPEVALEDEDAELPEWLKKAAFAEGLIEQPPAEASVQPGEGAGGDVISDEPPDVPSGEEETEDEPDWLKLFQQKGPARFVAPEDSDADVEGMASAGAPGASEETLEIPEWLQLLRQGEDKETGESTGEDETEAETAPPAPAQPADQQSSDVAEPPMARTPSGVIPDHESAVSADPKDYATRWELIQAYAHAGNHEAAVEHCRYMVESGEFVAEVLEYLEGLSGTGTETRDIYQLLGDAYFKLDRFEEATNAYRNALSMLG